MPLRGLLERQRRLCFWYLRAQLLMKPVVQLLGL